MTRLGWLVKMEPENPHFLKSFPEKSISMKASVPEGNITIGFLKQDLDFVKGRTVWDETMQAYEQINAMKNELEDVNHQLATEPITKVMLILI
jgi:ATPase subunit of ABC transporter with duplicated ATPase domains